MCALNQFKLACCTAEICFIPHILVFVTCPTFVPFLKPFCFFLTPVHVCNSWDSPNLPTLKYQITFVCNLTLLAYEYVIFSAKCSLKVFPENIETIKSLVSCPFMSEFSVNSYFVCFPFPLMCGNVHSGLYLYLVMVFSSAQFFKGGSWF